MPRLKAPSLKQKRFVNNYLKHGNKTKAYMQATGNKNKKHAHVYSQSMWNSPMTQKYMKEVMDKAGLTPEKIAEGFQKITNAGLSKQSLRTATPAHALKALQEASKLSDLYPAEKKQVEKKELKLNLKGKSVKELQEELSILADEARSFNRMVKNEKGEVLP